jgi:uncharacterized damage-inducible protein DinB
MTRRLWFERRFALGLPPEAFPEIVERVRGTPARLDERIALVPAARYTGRQGDAWSIQENVGHLLDLEPLWAGRLDDLLEGVQELRPADLQNRKTHAAGHDEKTMAQLLAGFRAAREPVVRRLEELPRTDLSRTALHPRLRQPMSIVDLFFFVAEHDDHHLAAISALNRSYARP